MPVSKNKNKLCKKSERKINKMTVELNIDPIHEVGYSLNQLNVLHHYMVRDLDTLLMNMKKYDKDRLEEDIQRLFDLIHIIIEKNETADKELRKLQNNLIEFTK